MDPEEIDAVVQLLVPGLVGLMISLVFYGITLGQYFRYIRAFPHDKRRVKYFPSSGNQLWLCTFAYAFFLVTKFMVLTLPQQVSHSFRSSKLLRTTYLDNGRNKILTGAIFFLAVTQIVLGSAVMVLGPIDASVSRTPAGSTNGNDVLAPLPSCIMLVASVSAVAADILVSGSVYFYLRPGRSGVKRTETRIKHLTTVSINMGFLTCAVGITLVVFIGVPKLAYCMSAAAMIAAKSHVNSVLAVLNARKPDRQGQQLNPLSTIQLPAIPAGIPTGDTPVGTRDRTSRTLQEQAVRSPMVS
ncbi:hypothetical protein BV22DRAFT_1130559 [Leucogyrophana mollusca]|uniref:Uncharacterized protein n=1 Tax=Leucogyrophana mollusca TaxID=85980 RepID=A0ACB8BDW2_9AGAM|nr:hypothetical protein BV22DRAFT_1130559 [Leucogyrophana mollusca]